MIKKIIGIFIILAILVVLFGGNNVKKVLNQSIDAIEVGSEKIRSGEIQVTGEGVIKDLQNAAGSIVNSIQKQ